MPRSLVLLAIALLVPLAACDTTGGADQRLFEDQAFFSPPGTAPAWRIGPAFDARVQLTDAPPGPVASGADTALQLYVSYAAPGGFALYRLNDLGELDLIQALPGQGQPWFYTFTFRGGEADPFGRPGTYRLLVLDAGQRVVAFGDLTVT